MFFRTLATYFTLVKGLVGQYKNTFKGDKIAEEKGIAEGKAYSANIAAQVLKDTLRAAGVKVIVTGQENIPKDRNFVLIANHQSMVDVFAIMDTLDRPIGFVAKAELKKVPFLNRWMNSIGCVLMNRSDMRQSMQTILDGIKLVKAGCNIGIFPEGTRTDGKMLKFKGGAFKLATKSGAPILPVTIDGTHRVLEDNHFWVKDSAVRVTYHPIIETKDMPREEQSKLPELVQDIIGSALKEEERFAKE